MLDLPTDPSTKPVKVSSNAGVTDPLLAAGRLLLIVIGTLPVLITLLKARDLASLIAFFQGSEGATFIAAVSGLAAVVFALLKSRKRAVQVVAVAADRRTPDAVAQIK